ncbi:hypothetical protein Cgig2_022507 [Carnegiea gigantea]|uniref:Uncharacterized protein n=1 Tax=Carnegiea gigantea TaxID=171969 RepID=A0A9Q1K9I6_9CARY|nr:hypothetical protein Cgig2_022507 [Carnegiea gigantea]
METEPSGADASGYSFLNHHFKKGTLLMLQQASKAPILCGGLRTVSVINSSSDKLREHMYFCWQLFQLELPVPVDFNTKYLVKQQASTTSYVNNCTSAIDGCEASNKQGCLECDSHVLLECNPHFPTYHGGSITKGPGLRVQRVITWVSNYIAGCSLSNVALHLRCKSH